MEDKIINNRYDKIEYGTEGLGPGQITVNPAVADRYEESLSENIEDVYTRKKLFEKLAALHKESPFYEKYPDGDRVLTETGDIDNERVIKKLEKKDLQDVYCYYKNKLMEDNEYSIVQVFCTIAEFFDINYKTLYHDIASLEDKAAILETLDETMGLKKNFSRSKKLF